MASSSASVRNCKRAVLVCGTCRKKCSRDQVICPQGVGAGGVTMKVPIHGRGCKNAKMALSHLHFSRQCAILHLVVCDIASCVYPTGFLLTSPSHRRTTPRCCR